MKSGERIDLSGVVIEVTGLGKDGLPSEAVFRFDKRLDDASLKWF